jgi:hypothetical protein
MTWITLLGVAVAIALGLVSLRETNKSLRQNNLATIYTLGFEITKYQQENPKLAKFLDKQLRQPWITEKEYLAEVEAEVEKLPKEQQAKARDEYKKLWEEYSKVDEDKQTLLYLGCERIADFSQIAYMQREVLPDEDWNTWWSYITDQYDESPFYRVFLSKRPTWYAFLEDIKPGKRDRMFRR